MLSGTSYRMTLMSSSFPMSRSFHGRFMIHTRCAAVSRRFQDGFRTASRRLNDCFTTVPRPFHDHRVTTVFFTALIYDRFTTNRFIKGFTTVSQRFQHGIMTYSRRVQNGVGTVSRPFHGRFCCQFSLAVSRPTAS